MKRDITRNTISTKFIELLEKKSIEHITIREIVELADINRQTFYYHFKDIYDLMEWTLQSTTKKYLQSTDDDSIEGHVALLFRCFYANKVKVQNGYNQSHRRLYENVLKNLLSERMRKRIKDIDTGEHLGEEKVEFLVNYYTVMAVSMILEWVETGMQDEHQINLDETCILLKEMIEAGVKLFIKKK